MESVPVEEVVFRAPPGYCHVCGDYIPDGAQYAYVLVPNQQREGLLCDGCWAVVEEVLRVMHKRAQEIDEAVRHWHASQE